MKTYNLTPTDITALEIDAVIRIKDNGSFFDSDNRRLIAMLCAASNCELSISHIGVDTDIIITFTNIHHYYDTPPIIRNSYPPFNREVVRVGLLLEKLANLIDRKNKIEIDYPDKETIIGRSVANRDDFMREFPKNDGKEQLSKRLSWLLERKIDSFIDMVIPPQNYMMGMCHSIWAMKKTILRYGFNIDWKTPSELHPDVLFD